MQAFETKVRNVGTSLGVLIPKNIAKENKIKKGQQLTIAIMIPKDPKTIEKMFGIDKGAKPFEREHIDREL